MTDFGRIVTLCACVAGATLACANRSETILREHETASERTSPPMTADDTNALKEPPTAEVLPEERSRAPVAHDQESFVRAFDREGRDPQWSSGYEQHIAETMQFFQNSKVRSVECRTTVCKIVVDHASVDAGAYWRKRFTRELMKGDGLKEMAYLSKLDETMKSHTMYLTRLGYTEPHPDGTPRLRTEQ